MFMYICSSNARNRFLLFTDVVELPLDRRGQNIHLLCRISAVTFLRYMFAKNT